MKPIIDQAFWADPAIEESDSAVKLAALWLMTNPQTSLLGICSASVRRFEFETGLPGAALEAALRTLPHMFQRFEGGIFIRGYVRQQFGAGEKLTRNNFFAGLKSLFVTLRDAELRAAIVAEYPEFAPHPPALPRASEGLPKPKDERERKDKDAKDEDAERSAGESSPVGSGMMGLVAEPWRVAETSPPRSGSVDLSRTARAADPDEPTRGEAGAHGREPGMDETEADAWSDHFASNGWRVSGRTADWGYRPDVPEGVCAVRGALRVAGRRGDGGGGVRARWRSSRGPARLGPIAAPPVRYVAANLFAEPGPRFPRRAPRRVTSKGVDPPCRRHGWTDQTGQAKKSGRLFVFTPQNVDSRHPFLAIGLALVLAGNNAFGVDLVEPKDVLGVEEVCFSDGGSIYIFRPDGKFALEPVHASGRTIVGNWKFDANGLHITGAWSWINGLSVPGDRREMDIHVGYLGKKLTDHQSTITGETHKIREAYFLIERLEKQK